MTSRRLPEESQLNAAFSGFVVSEGDITVSAHLVNAAPHCKTQLLAQCRLSLQVSNLSSCLSHCQATVTHLLSL